MRTGNPAQIATGLFSNADLWFYTAAERKGGPLGRDISHIDAFKAAARKCPLPSAIDLIGEKWAFLIVRGALNGLQHFEEFQACLGIARNILSDRLARMVAGGILERSPDPRDRRKVVYALTQKGEGLLPVVLALRQWGLDWGHGSNDCVAADLRDGKPICRICIHAHDGRELKLDDLMWIDSSGSQFRRPLQKSTPRRLRPAKAANG